MSGNGPLEPGRTSGELLRVLSGPAAGTELSLGDSLVIGRALRGAGRLAGDEELSRSHARITRHGAGMFVLEDLGSTNGTYLNGWKIPAPQRLSSGDRITVGQSILEVAFPFDPERTAQRRRPVVLAGAPGADELRSQLSSAALHVTGLQKAYGSLKVLHGVDLEIEPGEVTGLLGHNGAGKSTFVTCVSGLRKADSGSVWINGVDAVADPRGARRHLGIAPQDLGIYPTQTVRRNLEFFGGLAGLRGSELSGRVEEVGEALSLTPKFDAAASTLSGGQKRRLHTGMAMVHRPPLLILDEPTVGADIRTRQEILDLVKKLANEGHAVCYSTHYLPEIEELGASVALLQGGKIIARGSIAELVAKHATQAVELEFDGVAPDLLVRGHDVSRNGSVLRITTDNPPELAASVLGLLGAHIGRLRNVELIRPSLDSVYLSLTDQRYSAGEQPAERGAGTSDGRNDPGAGRAAIRNTGINWAQPQQSQPPDRP